MKLKCQWNLTPVSLKEILIGQQLVDQLKWSAWNREFTRANASEINHPSS